MKYIALFVLIQLASLVLAIIGLPIIAYFAFIHPTLVLRRSPLTGKTIVQFPPRWVWLWNNDEDGAAGGYEWNKQWSIGRRLFTWSALRNPVNNLRFVRGVSAVGRPLFYRTRTIAGRLFYVKAGWMTDGYPALSAGSGRGF